ncbi:MAG TPA: PAS domain-containing protein [Candidatus Saccharimonadales bacterium]|nr:PAS domain-containing protein [Candidatus Saccharimonadales bacterium]
MQLVISIITFLLSSIYVLFLDHIAASARSLEKALILPIVILLFAIYRISRISWKEFENNNEKWIFLFWGAALIQMLVLATGGLHSPFLILIHLFMIGLCFVFTFPVALFFLISSFVVIFIDISLHQSIISVFLEDPSSMVLELVSLISIIPIAYVISQKYHVKDWLSSVLRKKVLADETILESLHELIIVTDANFRILSVNDAVERTLLQSRSELMYTPIFNALLLKDKNGKLVTKETFFPKGDISEEPIAQTDFFTIVKSSLPQRDVTIEIQPIKDTETNINQLSFILTSVQQFAQTGNTTNLMIERARVTYEAMNEDIKKKLSQTQSTEIQAQLLLLGKIESDIYNVLLLKGGLVKNASSRIDIAKLGKNIAALEQDFANAFHTIVDFQLTNFGTKDIAPLTVEKFQVTPEELTGPFFTVACDVKNVELVIKKLLDLSIFLSSTEKNPHITVAIERGEKDTIIVKITGSCPPIKKEEHWDMFVPYYGVLLDKTNLHLGSGLEGFLVKTISDTLDLALEITTNDAEGTISFMLKLNRFDTVTILPKEASVQKQ